MLRFTKQNPCPDHILFQSIPLLSALHNSVPLCSPTYSNEANNDSSDTVQKHYVLGSLTCSVISLRVIHYLYFNFKVKIWRLREVQLFVQNPLPVPKGIGILNEKLV